MLEIEKLTHRFGGLSAVTDFNLSLQRGELMGIIGPNGAGKTTLFNLITGIYRASEGSLRFEGRELVGRAAHEIVNLGIARTFQNIRVFREMSVLDNVRAAHYAHVRDNPLAALCRTPGFRSEERRILEHSLELLSTFKLESHAGKPAGSLPYGSQRRLEIARALATRPKLLLLDEPAAGMNASEIGQLMEFIAWIRREFDLTIILIEHSMRLVMAVCERLKVLDFGTTIAEGDPSKIRADRRVLEAYLGEEVTP